MQLTIKPYHENQYPLGGILVQGQDINTWLAQIQELSLSLHDTVVYAIPDATPNSVWGCLLIPAKPVQSIPAGRNRYCQLINHQLFIPEQATLYPRVTETELAKLLGKSRYLLHATLGLIELEIPFQWQQYLQLPHEQEKTITTPARSVYLPGTIRSFMIKVLSPEAALQQLETNSFPQQKKLTGQPLSVWEKIKLFLLRPFFKNKNKEKSGATKKTTGFSRFLDQVDRVARKLAGPKLNQWLDKVQANYEELENRNRKEVDKLLDLFKNNPEDALQYAIPLDEQGSERGATGGGAEFDLSRRWFDFSFRNTTGGGSGPSIILGDDTISKLRAQYNATAEALIRQGEYERAAFVYMKLLKLPFLAAQALEKGGFYAEAAAIYLKYGEHTLNAASCYEKGNMTEKAIELYVTLGKHEKAGDLYMTLGKKQDALYYYNQTADTCLLSGKYVEAATLYREKMFNPENAQEILLKGWRTNKEALSCLGKYLEHLPHDNAREEALVQIYTTDVTGVNWEIFLAALRQQHDQRPAVATTAKEIAYEMIAGHVNEKPGIVSELRFFNKDDKNLVKDIILYKRGKKEPGKPNRTT